MITVLEKDIPLYGIFCIIGIIFAVGVGFILIRKRKIEPFDFACAGVFILIGAIIGSKLLFLALSWKQIIALKLSVAQILQGGFVFYGGLLGGALGLLLYVKIYKENLKDYLDVCAVALPLGHAFGRIGCFFGGCCYGIPYDGVGAYTYTESLNFSTPLGVPLLPIQLIESACLFALFGALIVLFYKKRRKFNAYVLYLNSYAVLRFVLEFFRGDKERGKWLLSTSQWISVALLITLFIVWLVKRKKRKRKESTLVRARKG